MELEAAGEWVLLGGPAGNQGLLQGSESLGEDAGGDGKLKMGEGKDSSPHLKSPEIVPM